MLILLIDFLTTFLQNFLQGVDTHCLDLGSHSFVLSSIQHWRIPRFPKMKDFGFIGHSLHDILYWCVYPDLYVDINSQANGFLPRIMSYQLLNVG